MTLLYGSSFVRISLITFEASPFLEIKKTSSSASMVVEPEGIIDSPFLNIAATLVSTLGMCFFRSLISWPIIGPPLTALTATKLSSPSPNSRTWREPGMSISPWI